MPWDVMHEVFKIKSLKPIPKFLQKLNNFEKPQNLDLNAWNAWIMREKEIIPSNWKQGKAENHVDLKVLREKWVFGRWGDGSIERDRG